MTIVLSQIYSEAGASLPFSLDFEAYLTEELTEIVRPSPKFVAKYGEDFELSFILSVKTSLKAVEVRGPSVYRKHKHVDYSLFIPFADVPSTPEVLRTAMQQLFAGITSVLRKLEIDPKPLATRAPSLIDHILRTPKMVGAV